MIPIEQQVISALIGIDRSLVGRGVLYSLNILALFTELKIYKIESNTQVEDWIIPNEWILNTASISDTKSKELLFSHQDSQLRVVKYSSNFTGNLSYDDLKKHLFVDENIPYRTTYYNENWGFCLNRNEFDSLNSSSSFRIKINSKKKADFLYYGEKFLKGKSKKEILFTTYICHPGLVNDNLSGVASMISLIQFLESKKSLNYSYRCIIIPETIGAISYLSENSNENTVIGLNIHCMSGDGPITFKKSPNKDSNLNYLLEEFSSEIDIRSFEPFGSDERQFCSKNVNLDYGSLSRTPYGEFPEYHNSADSIDNYKINYHHSINKFLERLVVNIDSTEFIKCSEKYSNTKGELFLSKHNLYRKIGGVSNISNDKMNIINWTLYLSRNQFVSLELIRKHSNLDLAFIKDVVSELKSKGLLE